MVVKAEKPGRKLMENPRQSNQCLNEEHSKGMKKLVFANMY